MNEHERKTLLDEFDTDELLDELAIRCDQGVFVVMNCDDQEGHNIRRRWCGNSHACIGLAHDVAQVILAEYKKRVISIDGEDE